VIEPLTPASLRSGFKAHFGGPARLFRSPARINIIGEHTDYNDGLVMPTNTDLHTWLAIAPRDDRIVRMYASRFSELAEVSLDDLHTSPNGGWQEYPKGVLQVLQRKGFELGGADILIAGDIPLGSGLSSSASLETAVGYAMLACADHHIDRRQLAISCREAENDFVGVSCGIMDQYVVAICENDHAMLLDCRSLDYELVPLSNAARLVIIDSGVAHRHREGGYNTRQDECRQATAVLANGEPGILALRDVSRTQLEAARDKLGGRLYRRARHVVTEIDRVRAARQALLEGDLASLGDAMTASHASLKDDFEVSCDAVDLLVDIALGCDGVLGSRMVGGGFGGCTVSLVDDGRVEAATAEICREYQRRCGVDPWHHILQPSDAVHEVPC
jgi:galactokinase